MAAGSVILGVAPQLAVNYLLNPILNALQMSAVNVTWLGLSADAGSFSSVAAGAGRLFIDCGGRSTRLLTSRVSQDCRRGAG